MWINKYLVCKTCIRARLSLGLGFRGFLFWKFLNVVVDPFLNYTVDLLSDLAVCRHFDSRAP